MQPAGMRQSAASRGSHHQLSPELRMPRSYSGPIDRRSGGWGLSAMSRGKLDTMTGQAFSRSRIGNQVGS